MEAKSKLAVLLSSAYNITTALLRFYTVEIKSDSV